MQEFGEACKNALLKQFEEERITISGNIDLNLEKKENADEEEENMTKMLEKHMESLKKDMNLLEKRG